MAKASPGLSCSPGDGGGEGGTEPSSAVCWGVGDAAAVGTVHLIPILNVLCSELILL